jgi:hypothetical protein
MIDIISATLLFILLSPGFLLELPKLRFMTHKTSTLSVAIHAVIYAIVFMFLQLNEGFQNNTMRQPTAKYAQMALAKKNAASPPVMSSSE